MSLGTYSVDQLVEVLGGSVQKELERRLREKLMEVARPIVDKTAEELAKSIKGVIQSHTRIYDNTIHVVLKLDTKDIPVE